MRPLKRTAIWAAAIILVLAGAFLLQPDGKPKAQEKPVAPAYTAGAQTPAVEDAPSDAGGEADKAPYSKPAKAPPVNSVQAAPQVKEPEQAKAPEPSLAQQTVTEPPSSSTQPAAEEAAPPQKEENQAPPSPSDSQKFTCSLAIDCSEVLANMDKLAEEKKPLAPSDGLLLNLTDVEFSEGESVFEVLVRELKNRNVHIEFSLSPLYGTAYIEGICNLYEFDCGELSGWIYSVNGDFPSLGCDKYTLSDKDSIVWVYTCDMGDEAGRS